MTRDRRLAALVGVVAFDVVMLAVLVLVRGQRYAPASAAAIQSAPVAVSESLRDASGAPSAPFTRLCGCSGPPAAEATAVAASPVASPADLAALPGTHEQLFEVVLPLTNLPISAWSRFRRRAWCESRFIAGMVGDDGRAVGLLQIRVDQHPDLARRYDLFDPVQNLNAAYELEGQAARMRLPTPWATCDGA